MQNHLSRVWFLNQGCKQVPQEHTGGKVLWAQPIEGYFLSAQGTKQKPTHGPANRKRGWHAYNGKRGIVHPQMRHFGCKYAHRLMAYTFAETPCPIFLDSKGRPYKGLVHHVIENPYDIRLDNLLFWLDHHQHRIADKRRQALEKVLPDMYVVPTCQLKTLQDPRLTSAEDFEIELQSLRKQYGN